MVNVLLSNTLSFLNGSIVTVFTHAIGCQQLISDIQLIS